MKRTNFYSFLMGKGLLLLAFVLCGISTFAQVTTSTITGLVTDKAGEGLPGATVVATHVASGSKYGTVTNVSGRYTLPAVRVGGPFSVMVTYTGFDPQTRDGIFTSLGVASNVNFQMAEAGATMAEVVVVERRNDLFSSDRTGAATTFDRNVVTSVPTIGSRTINDVTKYNPNGNGRSFGAQDSRLNNFTIDGSVFNNGFGLGSDAQAGGRTGSTAISLDAIEELQVNVAPFDVRQSGFVGSGINAVTRSGTNDYSGSVYYNFRNNNFYGDKAGDATVTVSKFDEKVIGARVGGPLIKNKLFFFLNGEIVRKIEPATPWVAKGSTVEGQVTRVEKTDLEGVRDILKTKFGYETGAYENYDNETTSDKFLARLDYNLSQSHKVTLRYTHHNSLADVLISNSNSAGAGNRRSSADAMSFQNSGYYIGDNTRSIVAEVNSTISDKLHNNFIVGYDYQNEDRKYKSDLFPTVDILKDNRTYISVGMDPFTPSNKLDYGTFHVTDNVSLYLNKHTVTFGANYEAYKSNNLFFPASNGVYVYNSLQDFYDAVNFDGDTSPVKVNRFQYRYSALAGGEEPLQVLKANKFDLYGQDEFQVTRDLKILLGIRAGFISFGNTALENPTITAQTYRDEDNNLGYKINTGKMPNSQLLFEPRFGFNYDVMGKKKTQIRGGAGIFTGRPPYVWVSNQVGNNGVLTGFIDRSGTTAYKFTDDPSIFTPATPTLPSTFDIAAADPDYKFPQIIKTNLAVDHKLPFGFVGSLEFLLNKNLNAVRYWDANLEPATQRFTGVDQRPRFPGSGLSGTTRDTILRINNNVSRAAVMGNTNEGSYFGATVKLEYPNKNGLYGMAAYTYAVAKDLMSAGSIAAGSWTSVRTVDGNNILPLAFADQDQPHRVLGLLGYRIEYGGEFGGATQFSLGYVGENRAFNPSAGIVTSRYSWSIAGDMNGDGISNNDLIFVPNQGSDLVWQDLKVTITNPDGTKQDKTFTAADQAAAWDAFVAQDDYLSTRKGQYAERNGGLYPMLHRFDLSVAQEAFIKIGGKKNTIQFRADILNFANLINKNWGVSQVPTTDRPLTFRKVGTDGKPEYTMATQTIDGNPALLRDSTVKGSSSFDVWSMQLGIRYIFN